VLAQAPMVRKTKTPHSRVASALIRPDSKIFFIKYSFAFLMSRRTIILCSPRPSAVGKTVRN
jgi:hypothetical protein